MHRLHYDNLAMSRRKWTKGVNSDIFETQSDEDHVPDFSSVALYVPALQVVAVTLACCVVSILSCWALPHTAISSIRSVSLTLAPAVWFTREPYTMSATRTRGVEPIFHTIRPAVFVYITALVVEQLAHSCVTQGLSMAVLRGWLFQGCMAAMMLSGFVRAWYPRHENDAPLLVSLAALGVAAVMPPSPEEVGGPLCAAATMGQAVERIFRALLFASTYCTLAFATQPQKFAMTDIMVSSLRAASGSIWILGSMWYFLALAPVQIALIMFSRLMRRDNRGYAEASTDVEEGDSFESMSPCSPPTTPRLRHEWTEAGEYTKEPTVQLLTHDQDTLSFPAYTDEYMARPLSPSSSTTSGQVPSMTSACSKGGGFSFAGVIDGMNGASLCCDASSSVLSPSTFHQACSPPALRCISGVDATASSGNLARMATNEQLKAAAEAMDV